MLIMHADLGPDVVSVYEESRNILILNTSEAGNEQRAHPQSNAV